VRPPQKNALQYVPDNRDRHSIDIDTKAYPL